LVLLSVSLEPPLAEKLAAHWLLVPQVKVWVGQVVVVAVQLPVGAEKTPLVQVDVALPV